MPSVPNENREAILSAVAENDSDFKATANAIYRIKDLAIYAMVIGIENIVARERAEKRRELRAVVQPEFVKPAGKSYGSVVLTERSKQRMVEHAHDLFNDWKINATVTLGNATREELLHQAQAETLSAHGHSRNAAFYQALAEPLKPGQRVIDFWRDTKRVTKLRDKIWHQEVLPV